MTPGAIQRPDQGDELWVLGQAKLILVAGVMVHVLARGHPTRMHAVERDGELPKLAGEERVAAVELPAIHAPVKHLLLEAMPPLHGVGVGVVNEPALAFPPAPLVAVAGQVALGSRLVKEVLRLLDLGVLAETVHHAGHPENHTVALVLQAAEELLRLRVVVFVHLEVVVAPAPRDVDEEGAHRKVVLRIALQQLLHVGRGVDVVLPQPALQRPGRGQRHAAVARLVERNAPEGKHVPEVDEGGQQANQEEQCLRDAKRAAAFGSAGCRGHGAN